MEINEIKVGMRFMDKDARRLGRTIEVVDAVQMDSRGFTSCLVQRFDTLHRILTGKRYLVPSHRLVNLGRFSPIVRSEAELPPETAAVPV